MRLGGWLAGLAVALGLVAAAAEAQSPFSAAVSVNDRAITNYELDQRQRLLRAFGTRGDLAELARTQLIEERVKQDEFARRGIALTDEGLAEAMTDFAARADLSLDEFLALLARDGIDEESFRDYVKVNVSWRDFIRGAYGDRVVVTESDIDAAIANRGIRETGIEVLLSEIIIPAPPPQAAEALARAETISQTTSFDAFEAAARDYSALPSREQGGRLDWLPIEQYPAPIRSVLLDLAPGEVTEPIEIPNGVALFQLRDVRETVGPPRDPARIDYATFALPGGLTAAGLAEAAKLQAGAATCDELYPLARGLSPSPLTREEAAPPAIPSDIALELSRLDPGESSAVLTRNGGEVLLFVMLCGRSYTRGAAGPRGGGGADPLGPAAELVRRADRRSGGQRHHCPRVIPPTTTRHGAPPTRRSC